MANGTWGQAGLFVLLWLFIFKILEYVYMLVGMIREKACWYRRVGTMARSTSFSW